MVSLAAPSANMPPPPLTPRPSIGMKRDSSHLSSPSNHDSLMSSQLKRLKVAFDDNVDVRIVDDWTSKPLELVREEVRYSIEGHLRPGNEQNDTGYEQLRQLFVNASIVWDTRRADSSAAGEDAPGTALLKKYIVALLGRVSELKGCARLVLAALDVNWVGRDETFTSLFVRFMGAVASAIPGFMRTIMEKIIRQLAALPPSLGRISGEPVVNRQHLVARLHHALKYLLRFIPSASSSLSEVIRNEFPNHRIATRRGYVAYVKNILKVVEFAPELRAETLTLITERLVKLDVEVQDELDELDEDAGNVTVAGKTSKALDDESDGSDESDAESVSSTELSSTAEEHRIKALRETVAKLDASLNLLFDYYTDIFVHGKSFESNDAFEHLLSQFATFVLPTYRSRHTQFLIFHFSQATPAHVERFVGTCIRLSISRGGVASNGSLSAVAYLASFISRGAKLQKRVIREVVTVLGQHLVTLSRTHESTCRGPDLARYGLYYAVSQAMLYIFCFRWRDLIDTSAIDGDTDLDDYDVFASGEPVWIPGIKELYTRSIYSRLNPLKVCSPTIVQQFAAIANHLRFMFVFPLLETNKRLRLSSHRSYTASSLKAGDMGAGKRESALSRKSGEGHFQLESFFPFDPYQLPLSKKWLEGDYVVWKGVPGMEKEVDDDSEGSEDESEEDEDLEEDGDVDDVASRSS